MSVPYEKGISDLLNSLAKDFAECVINAIEGTPTMKTEYLEGVDDSTHGMALFYIPLQLKDKIEKLIDQECGEMESEEELRQEYGD